MKVIPRLPFRDWAKKAETGEMPETRRMCSVMAAVLRPQMEELERIRMDMMIYGTGAYEVSADGTVHRIPPGGK